jgi:flagellar protein FlaG
MIPSGASGAVQPAVPRQVRFAPPAATQDKVASEDAANEEPEVTTDRVKIQEVAAKANAHLNLIDTKLHFSISEHTGNVVIRVINRETQEVIREIPPEKLQRFAERFAEMRGMLFESTG